METPEIRAILNYVMSCGVPHRVTSTVRPGAGASRHADGLAVDFGHPGHPGRNTPELLAIFKAFEPVEHSLHELIYSPAGYSIKRGQRVPRYAIAGHFDHVHVSVDRGVLLPYRTEVTLPADDPNVPNLDSPLFGFYPIAKDGVCTGYYIVSQTGEVHGHGPGAPYLGRSEAPKP